MLSSPDKRSARSSIRARLRKAWRINPGLKKGKTPSMSSIKAKPINSSCPMRRACYANSRVIRRARPPRCPRLTSTGVNYTRSGSAATSFSRAAELLPARVCIIEVFEEVAFGIDHQHVIAILERRAIGLQAAIEGIELLILIKGFSIGLRGLAVAFTAHFLRGAVGLGDDFGAAPIGVRADALRLLRALRTPLARDPRPLRLHAAEDRVADIRGQVHALEAHVDDADAELLSLLIGADRHEVHDLPALTRDDLLNGALAKLTAQAVLDDLRETHCALGFIAAHRGVEAGDIVDTPLHEGVDDHGGGGAGGGGGGGGGRRRGARRGRARGGGGRGRGGRAGRI